MKNPTPLLTSLCQAHEQPGVRGNIPEQTIMTDDFGRHIERVDTPAYIDVFVHQ